MRGAITIIIFVIITLIMTFPLIFKFSTHIPGFFDTSESQATIWGMWWDRFSWLNKLPYFKHSYLAAPFGIDKTGGKTAPYFLWMYLGRLLTVLINEILAYNLQIILSFILAGIFTYLLVRYLTNNFFVALLSGVIFSFCPYHFVRVWQHFGLSQIQWMPLYVFNLIKLKEEINFKNTVFTALSLFLVVSFDLYYFYFMLIVSLVFLVFVIFYFKNLKIVSNLIKKLIISLTIFLVFFFHSLISIIKGIISPSKEILALYRRPFEDLFTQSAKPLSYFLPAVVHPVFGKFTERFIGSPLYGVSFTEHTLYLGWTPIILSFIAYRQWRKKRRAVYRNTSTPEHPATSEDFYIGFFIFLAIVAWFFSQPPWWRFGPIKIYMPSFFMYKILPMFRAYCRFGIVVMLAISVLAGYGLKNIISKIKNQKLKIVITGLFCGLVLFEFWNWPPYKVIDVSRVPEVYYWLKEQSGDFVIAEYPLDAESPNEMYKFYQTVHEKKIINGTIPGTYANKVAQEIRKLSEPQTAEILKWMGVKYVIVHRDGYLNSDLLEDRKEFEKISQNHYLKLVKSFPSEECPQENIMCVKKTGPIDVYEIFAEPMDPRNLK